MLPCLFPPGLGRNFRCFALRALLALAVALLVDPVVRASQLNLPPEAVEGQRLLYNGQPDQAIELFRKLEDSRPDHPLGYLLEANARWWKIYCEACAIKWGMIDAWHREKMPADRAYFALADKGIALAEAQLAKNETPEMHFYAGLGYLLRGRLLGLRDERRATARAGVKARAHLLRAIALDPNLDDAYTGLGLYNYYVDTLSAIAKILRFFMGIPGGSKKEGIRQLEIAMDKGELTAVEARFYLAKNLRNYDREYARAAQLLKPLTLDFPDNPIFHLLLGDLDAKLRRNDAAAASYREAARLSSGDPACADRIQTLARAALAALNEPRNAR